MKNSLSINLMPTLVVMTLFGLGCFGSDSLYGQSGQLELRGGIENSVSPNSVTPVSPQSVTGASEVSGAVGSRGLEPQQDAQQESAPTQFLRVTKDGAGKPLAMQTAITRYRPEKGELVVDLVGAVHIGEAEYYKTLNDQFEHYDVVLYELVAPQGTRVPAGGKKQSGAPQSPLDLIGFMQKQAQSTLGLASQLEKVNYQKKNFTHADLSPTEMSEKMAERGDTPLTLGLSAFAEIMRNQNKAAAQAAKRAQLGEEGQENAVTELTPENMMDLLNDPLKLKLMMANQFTQSGVMEVGLGASLNQVVVTDRNQAAMKVLQKEIVNGKKKIAIFYGAAHMPDFEKRLAVDFGLTNTKQIWIDAWDLTKAGKKPRASGTTKMLFRLLNEMSK